MKLHANAALSLNKATPALRAGRRRSGAPLPRRGRRRPRRSTLDAAASADAHERGARAGDRRAAARAAHGRADRRGTVDAAVDGLRDPDADRAGQALATRAARTPEPRRAQALTSDVAACCLRLIAVVADTMRAVGLMWSGKRSCIRPTRVRVSPAPASSSMNAWV